MGVKICASLRLWDSSTTYPVLIRWRHGRFEKTTVGKIIVLIAENFVTGFVHHSPIELKCVGCRGQTAAFLQLEIKLIPGAVNVWLKE